MARPRMCRKIRFRPQATYFKPRGIPMKDLEVITMTHEEIEAIRLKVVKKLDQIEAAKQMNTSQSTFQRILTSAYNKMGDALINGKAIEIIE